MVAMTSVASSGHIRTDSNKALCVSNAVEHRDQDAVIQCVPA